MKKDKSEKKQFSDRQLCIFMYLLTFLMMIVLGIPLSVSYILDETGTVANAAFLAGYNWNDWVNSTGGYFYKYGQSIFYFPILKFVSNPYLIYKMMMLVNGIFIAFIPVVVYNILRKHLCESDKIKCVLTSLCIAVIPAAVLYSLYARADVMLVSFAWITLYFLLECANAQEKIKRVVLSALTAFFSVYMYMCHSRGVVFVIAVFMIVFFVRFFEKNKNICFTSYLISLLIWMFVDSKLTKYFKNSIWGSGNKKNTLESVKVEKYKNIFTLKGMETLLKNISGWLFNSFLGTYGLAVLGIFFAIVIIVLYLIKKKNITLNEFIVNIYAVLIYMGTLAMGALFSFGSNYKFVIGEKIKRADRFLYSRYIAPTYGVLMLIAIFYLFFKTERFGMKTKIATLLFGGILIIYCGSWLPSYVNHVEYSWRNTIDSALFFDTIRYGNDANSYSNVSRALIMAVLLSFAVLSILILFNYLKMNKNYVFVFIGVFLLTSLGVNYIKLRFATDIRPMNIVGSAITQMYEIEKKTGISEKYSDVYIDKTISRYKMMQLVMPQSTVHVRKSLEPENVDNMFILSKTYKVNEGWYGEDCYLFKDCNLEDSVTVVLVKGEELKDELEERGMELVEIPEQYAEGPGKSGGTPFIQAVKNVFEFQFQSFK